MDFSLSLNLADISKADNLDKEKIYDILVIGAGPAGLNGALYGKRKGLNVAILSKNKGGQVISTSLVENYLGISDLEGEDLAKKFLEHVDELDIPIIEGYSVVDHFVEGKIHNLILDSGEGYKAKAILIAMGSNPRKLSIPKEDELLGKGVSYCAICDGPFFKDKDVFVAGGGNAAVEAAIDLAKFASSVTLVQRSVLRADQILIDRLYENPKIKVLLKTRVLEVLGENNVSGIIIEDSENGERKELKGQGLFIEIGSIPNTMPFDNKLNLNDKGEIIVSEKKETNIKGIYAAGDVTDSLYKQIITSASDGATAALAINEYINQTNFN